MKIIRIKHIKKKIIKIYVRYFEIQFDYLPW